MKDEMTVHESGAKRVDAPIPPYAQIPSCALRRLALIFAEGELKYGRYNWQKGLPWYSTYNHLIEHLQKYCDGDRTEDHLAKVMWGVVVQMWFDEQTEMRTVQEAKFMPIRTVQEAEMAQLAKKRQAAIMENEMTVATARMLYDKPLKSQVSQSDSETIKRGNTQELRPETREERIERQTNQIASRNPSPIGIAEAQDLQAVSDFHDPTLTTGPQLHDPTEAIERISRQRYVQQLQDPASTAEMSTIRQQLEYNIQIAASRLEYGQGRDNLLNAVFDLVEYENRRALR